MGLTCRTASVIGHAAGEAIENGLSGAVEGGVAGYLDGGWSGALQGSLWGGAFGAITGGVLGGVRGGIDPKICFVAGTRVVVGVEEATPDDTPHETAKAGVVGSGRPAMAMALRLRYTTVAIEELVARGGGERGDGGGQWLIARDQHDPAGPLVRARVTRTYERTDYLLHALTLRDETGNEQTLRVTDEHPFYVAGRGWTAAKELLPGEMVLGGGGTLEVVANSVEEHPAGVPVYNLEVQDAHTYFVLAEHARQEAEAPWVHNASYPGMDNRSERIAHGGTDLAEAVLAERRQWSDPYSLKNGAAVEYLDLDGTPRTKVAFSGYPDHSEELLDRWLVENQIDAARVTRWYSERQPCMKAPHYCRWLVATKYPDAPVTWSVPFSTPDDFRRHNERLFSELRRALDR